MFLFNGIAAVLGTGSNSTFAFNRPLDPASECGSGSSYVKNKRRKLIFTMVGTFSVHAITSFEHNFHHFLFREISFAVFVHF
jgi:hypothetical protein